MTTRPFVFFDLGGTLVDLRGIVASMAARLRAARVRAPVPLALLWAVGTAGRLPNSEGPRFRPEREIAAEVLSELLEKRGRANTRDESIRLVREAWDGYVRSCALESDVSAAWLQGLRSQVTGLGLVTDGDSEAVAGVLAHLGLADFFDSITISEDIRSYKPNPRIYRAALEALGAKPSESLFVSDAPLDLQGAADLGMGAAWIRRNVLPDLAKPPPSAFVLTRLQDVEAVLRGYSAAGRFELR